MAMMMFPALISKSNSSYSLKYFSVLGCSFNEVQGSIIKKYKQKKTQPNLSSNQKDSIEESYLAIIDPKTKDRYMRYLAWNFIFSQPNNIESFKKNFHSYVSPHYIFSLEGEKPTKARYIKLNFLTCEISIVDKGEPLLYIAIDEIESITKEENSIRIGLFKDKKLKILLSPSIPTQNELIYILIMYMAYWKETQNDLEMNESDQIANQLQDKTKNKKETIVASLVRTEEEINIKELLMIQNDFYVPSGIVLRAKILIKKKKKHSDYERYIVLGNALIGIFKDDTMTKLLQVIPLIPLYVFFTFNHETIQMNIGIPNQDLIIYFNSLDEMQIWQAMIYNIADGKVEERISEEILTELYINSPIHGNDIQLSETSTLNRLETHINELNNHLNLLKSKKEEIAKYIIEENNTENK